MIKPVPEFVEHYIEKYSEKRLHELVDRLGSILSEGIPRGQEVMESRVSEIEALANLISSCPVHQITQAGDYLYSTIHGLSKSAIEEGWYEVAESLQTLDKMIDVLIGTY